MHAHRAFCMDIFLSALWCVARGNRDVLTTYKIDNNKDGGGKSDMAL